MDKKRVKREIRALEEKGADVKYNLHTGKVAIIHWGFPAGWTPRTGTILFDLPHNYPNSQPDVYLPDHMRYHGEVPRIMMTNSHRDGWVKHCIHDLRDEWNPHHHTMVSMLKSVKQSFRRPNLQDPWNGSHRRV